MVTRSMFSYFRPLTPGIERQGRTLAYNCSFFLSVTLRERWPLPIGVAKGPLRPKPCFFISEIVSGEIKSPSGVTAWE